MRTGALRIAARLLLLAVSVLGIAVAGELGLRWLDGFRLTSIRLVPVKSLAPPRPQVTEWPTAGANDVAAPHLDGIPRPAGVDASWFYSDPPPPPAKAPRPDLDALSNGIADQTLGKFARRTWNVNFVMRVAEHRDSYWQFLKQIKTPIRVFDPADHSQYPRYRLAPNDPHAEAWPTSTMSTNNLGYRGRDVSPAKPPRTCRIVFVGASTTIEHPSFPLTHPDYVGHYLNLWARARGLDVRFETINAAREGFQSTDLAAVVDQEVVPLSPDIVVYKEGANQFGEAKRLLTVSDTNVKPIGADFLTTGVVGGAPANYRSDVRRRWDTAIAAFRPLDEAPKPHYVVHWPAGLSEETPDVSRPDLPLDLPTIVRDTGHIRAALQTIGADLAVSSFVWMADDHLRLLASRPNERAIYWYLNGNEVVWPLTYHDIRRFADFQNRVFQRFTEADGCYFVDLARWFARDPALFIDGIHLSYPGIKLHGWITFLQLLPLVEQRLAAHATTTAPAIERPITFSTITIAEVEERLAAGARLLPVPALAEWRAGSPAVKLNLDSGRLSVEGTSNRWEYQVLSPDIPVEPDTTYRVTLPTTVTSGTIGIGVLDQSGATWISSPLDAATFTFFSGRNTKVQLVVADATPTGGTVTRSVFEIRRTP